MICAMKVALLVLALALMTASIIAPWFVRPSPPPPQVLQFQRVLVTGRVTGDFSDHPWKGVRVSLGSQKATLGEDGKFTFAALPGVHILRVCCSVRFQSIYREIVVRDQATDLELIAEPLMEISGRVTIEKRTRGLDGFKVSAWLIGTSTIERAVTAADGTFVFHVGKGKWEVDIDNLPKEYMVRSIEYGGLELHDRTFTILTAAGPSLPLQITLR
jgi:hypothetical protein